jgi:sec-independent protein translocase protein TatA
LIVVLIVALVVLGPKRLPEAGRSLGRGMREFKDSLTSGDADTERQEDRSPHGASFDAVARRGRVGR